MAIREILTITGFLGAMLGSNIARAEITDVCSNLQEKIRKCMALHGSDGQRTENTAWRKAHLPTMIAEEHGFTLIYLDESIERPIAAQMTGIRLEHVLTEEELFKQSNCSVNNAKDASPAQEPVGKQKKLWAKVRLPSQFTDLCGLKVAYLQVDDHLGAENQVVSLFPDGMLLKSGPSLFWVSVQSAAFFPEFRMVWQSSYRVTPSISHSSSGSKSKARKKSRKRKTASKRKKR